MKTVVHYRDRSYLSLTETWIYEQIKNLRRYQPIVYTFRTENLDIYPIEKIRSLGLKNGLIGLIDPSTIFNKAWYKISDFYLPFYFGLMKDKPQLIHAHFGPTAYSFLKLKKMFELPLITTFYGFDLSLLPSQHPEWKIKYKKLFKEGEKFLVEGNHMKKCLIELGCPEEKIIVQHLGIDLDKIKFRPRKLLSEDEEIRILISASFREKKGIPYAVEAFGRIEQNHPELKLNLTIIGDSGNSLGGGEEKKRIFNAIQKYNLKDCVNLLGYQPYTRFLRELYRHHIFIHPSVHASNGDAEGGSPVSITEASASGMPILSTTHCDIPEVVINGKSGYLVPERDVDALQVELENLVSNPVIWAKMGLYGRLHIEKYYDVKKQVERLEEIYDKVSIEG